MTDVTESRVDRAIDKQLAEEREWAAEARAKWLDRERKRLVRFLVDREGTLQPEDHGGAIGVVWHDVGRNAKAFHTPHIEAMREAGFTYKHEPYELAERGGLYRARKARRP